MKFPWKSAAEKKAEKKQGLSQLLVNSASAGFSNSIAELIRQGADVDFQNDKGLTALHMAVWAARVDNATHLLNAGASPNIKDETGSTAVISAAQSKFCGAMREMLQHGADVNIANDQGHTALHYAMTSIAENIDMLIDAKANIDAANNGGYTPLMWAVQSNEIDSARLLLAAGANAALENENGETALDLAHHEGHDAMIQLIEAHIGQQQKNITSEQNRIAAAAHEPVTVETLPALRPKFRRASGSNLKTTLTITRPPQGNRM